MRPSSAGKPRIQGWDVPPREALAAAPSLLLLSGGDERGLLDPQTGRNRYGLALDAQANEVYFGSSTASSLSRGARASVDEAWRRLTSPSPTERISPTQWFDEIRANILACCGAPEADCILTPSGTHSELVALALALGASNRPISNIVLAPDETGRGVMVAAGGAHFLGSAPFSEVENGARLAGWERADIRPERVEIRRADGRLRDIGEIDRDVAARAKAALAQGRSVLVHLLDVSKTGQSALSLSAARALRELAPERVFVLADCCQLRSPPSRLRELADAGCWLSLTGSKFAGGPPFSGALIVPRGLLDRLDTAMLPAGLGAHSARLDWPSAVAGKLAGCTNSEANFGLGLRWCAALGEMERVARVAPDLVAEIVARFRAETERGVAGVRGLSLLAPTSRPSDLAGSLLPILLRRGEGTPLTASEAQALQRALRMPIEGEHRAHARSFHVGQSVAIGGEFALRVCLSAPQINEVADRVGAGASVARAFAPLARDVRDLFDKWAFLWNSLGFADRMRP